MQTEITLQRLQQMVVDAQRNIEQNLMPEVRMRSTDPRGPLPSFPNHTASACLESLEKLADIHKGYVKFLEENHVMFGEDQWKRLEAAMEELGLEYQGAAD